MRYTKQAERIMENGGSAVDWYNHMSSGFYDFYEQVWGLVYNALLDQGYYMEASASNGSGVVDIYTVDKTGEPVGDPVVTVDMAEELTLFFELVASGEYATAKDIATELADEYMSIITTGSGPHKAAREAERKVTENWSWFNVDVVIDADTYPDLSRGGYKKKSSEKERIKLLETFAPVSPVKIGAFYKAPGNWYDQLSITGYCPPEIKKSYSWDDWNIIWQKAADKVFSALSDTEENSVNSNRRRVNSARLNSADQGFIKIGNKVIPTNTMDMGYADYDTVARRGRADYDAQERAKAEAKAKEEADRKAAELAAKGENLYIDFSETVGLHEGSINELDEKLNNLLVPVSGPADTAAGELLRAVERIGYRSSNDGDYFYGGYGLETAGPSAAYIAKYGEGAMVDIIMDAAEHEMDWPGYDKVIDKLYSAVVEYLLKSPELFKVAPPEDSRKTDDGILDKWRADHTYDFEISLEDFRYGLDLDWITTADVEDFIYNLAQQYHASYDHPYRDYYVITGLDPEDYEDLNDNFVRWVDDWMSDLEAEHEEEEYYDEDEEEED